MVWAQLVREADGSAEVAGRLLEDDARPLDLDRAAEALVSGVPRLIAVDDLDRGGAAAEEVLPMLAARVAGKTAVPQAPGQPVLAGRSARVLHRHEGSADQAATLVREDARHPGSARRIGFGRR